MKVVGWLASLLFLALVIAAIILLRSGTYGWTLFVVFPAILGGAAETVIRPRTALWGAGVGAFATAIGACSMLLVGIEGLYCVLMCLPIVIPLGAIGGYVAHLLRNRKNPQRNASMLILLPLASLTFDLAASPTVFAVHSQVTVAATPQQVWKQIVTFADLPEPNEWFFRAGLAYPKRARIEGTGPGAIRYCEFSTGPMVEPIDVWDQPHTLAFHVTESPAPMNEWSPYANVLPKHLHGYFISKKGQFHLTALPNGRTLLKGTTWYQHGLWPGEYWRWWSDAIIHRIHLRVLNHVKMLAEQDSSQ